MKKTASYLTKKWGIATISPYYCASIRPRRGIGKRIYEPKKWRSGQQMIIPVTSFKLMEMALLYLLVYTMYAVYGARYFNPFPATVDPLAKTESTIWEGGIWAWNKWPATPAKKNFFRLFCKKKADRRKLVLK